MRMNRLIYEEPHYAPLEAKQFVSLIRKYNGDLTDKELSFTLGVSEREVRCIAERFNNHKYLDFKNTARFSKVKGKYTVIESGTELGDIMLKRIRSNFKAECKRYINALHMLGNPQNGNKTILDMLDEIDIENAE
jgi:transcription initiation factor IIE alpha subunit